MWKFIKDHLSIDEFKVSALIIAFMAIIALIVYMTITQGDFSSNLLALADTLILTIGGVNAVNGLSRLIGKKDNQSQVQDVEVNVEPVVEANDTVVSRDSEYVPKG